MNSYLLSDVLDYLPIGYWEEIIKVDSTIRQTFYNKLPTIIASSRFADYKPEYHQALFRILGMEDRLMRESVPIHFEADYADHSFEILTPSPLTHPDDYFVSVKSLDQFLAVFLDNQGRVYRYASGETSEWSFLKENVVQLVADKILTKDGRVYLISEDGRDLALNPTIFPVRKIIDRRINFLGTHGEFFLNGTVHSVLGIEDLIAMGNQKFLILRTDGTICLYDTNTQQILVEDNTGDILQIVDWSGSFSICGALTVDGKILRIKAKQNRIERVNYPVPQNIGPIYKIHGDVAINYQGHSYYNIGRYHGSAAWNWIPVTTNFQLEDLSASDFGRTHATSFFGIGRPISNYFTDLPNIRDEFKVIGKDLWDNSFISYKVDEFGQLLEKRAWVNFIDGEIRLTTDNFGTGVKYFTDKYLRDALRIGKLYRSGEINRYRSELNDPLPAGFNLFYILTQSGGIRIVAGLEGFNNQILPFPENVEIYRPF